MRCDTQVHADRVPAGAPSRATGDVRVVIAALAALAAAWVAAGSAGLLAHPLRHALSLGLLTAAVLVLPLPARRGKTLLLAGAIAVVAVGMTVPSLPVANLGAAALVLAGLAARFSDRDRAVLVSAAVGVAALALYRTVYVTIPLAWMAADSLGHALGRLAGLLCSRPLNVGATFAGLDYLVAMLALWATWTEMTGPPRTRRALYGILAILTGHLVYLVTLSCMPDLLMLVPRPATSDNWSWAGLFHQAVPWNVPVLAGVIHVCIAAALFRWSAWTPAEGGGPIPAHGFLSRIEAVIWNRKFAVAPSLALLTAVLLPVVTSLYPQTADLQGSKIVFYEKGFLNWLKPTHGSYGRLGSGMYGMLPVFLESLGARPVVSPDLSDDDLRDAAALVLIFPDQPWAEGQLDRIWDFVRRGGSLLVLGEHTTRDPDGSSRFNDVLKPTSVRVAFDCATFAVGGWLQSYEAMLHPTTAGIPDDRNQLGIVIGASLQAGWRARPVVVGRWGWSDAGDEGSGRAMMGNDRYDPGERLGDLLLAAEQPVGRGKVVVFGDTSSLTNGINVSSHVFTSRLFAYLAADSVRARALWRQILGVLLAVALAGLLIRRPSGPIAALLSLGLAGSLLVTSMATARAWELLPDGRFQSPNNLAYIDTSHLEASSGESWRGDGVGGLVLTLMRNGYLTLALPQLDAPRLRRAGLLVSVAPHRPYTPAERAALRDFVERGGVLVLTVGCDQAGPSGPLLADFGFAVGTTGLDSLETAPMGHFKSPYLRSEDQRVFVRFHAAWPVLCSEPEAQVIAYGRDNVPVIVLRRIGAGKVVVIGDTRFATNDNLEREDGEPFEGLWENADFWRWFLTQLRGEPTWIPAALQGGSAADESPSADPQAEGGTPSMPPQEGTP